MRLAGDSGRGDFGAAERGSDYPNGGKIDLSALVQMLRRRMAALWIWQSLFVLAVIGGFVSHHLTV
jgi:hypothetical protein